MKRRKFISFLGGAVMYPLTAGAQKSQPTRRIGVLLPYEDERDLRAATIWLPLKQRLRELGWMEGSSIRFELRLTGEHAETIRVGAKELVATAPDVIVAFTNLTVPGAQQATQTIPIVFVLVSDPVGSGFVKNLARPRE